MSCQLEVAAIGSAAVGTLSAPVEVQQLILQMDFPVRFYFCIGLLF